MKVQVKVIIEVNDHDGYCSDGENEYKSNEYIEDVVIPEHFQHFILENRIDDFSWELVLGHLIPKLNNWGSGYCNIGWGQKYGLSRHDYRLTVLECKIIEQ